jgi:hypothetical protein
MAALRLNFSGLRQSSLGQLYGPRRTAQLDKAHGACLERIRIHATAGAYPLVEPKCQHQAGLGVVAAKERRRGNCGGLPRSLAQRSSRLHDNARRRFEPLVPKRKLWMEGFFSSHSFQELGSGAWVAF